MMKRVVAIVIVVVSVTLSSILPAWAGSALPYPVYPNSIPISERVQRVMHGQDTIEMTVGLYQTAHLPSDVQQFYRTTLQVGGWQVLSEEPRVHSVLYGKGEEHMSLLVSSQPNQSGTFIAVTYWQGELLVPQANQDAPGSDLPDVPRVPQSVRLSSQPIPELQGTSVVYKVDRFHDGIEQFYHTELVSRGWTLVRTIDPKFWRQYAAVLGAADGGVMWAFRRGEQEYCFLGIMPYPQQPHSTLISIVRLKLQPGAMRPRGSS